MDHKRMRYQWFQDVPRNVTRQEYQQLQLRSFGSIGLGLIAAIMSFAAVSGLTLQTSRTLEQIDGLSIQDAVNYQGDSLDLVQLDGYLVADNPPRMPDAPDQSVIRGRVQLSARAGTPSATPDVNPLPPVVLLEWEEMAVPVFLSDGDRRIPLGFDLGGLPMKEDLGNISPRLIQEGDSARTSRPVAIDYGDEIYPLPLESWGNIDSVFIDFDRQVLPHGQSVVVVARLEATPEGNQLIDPLGERLQVLMGTEESLRQQGQRMRIWFLILPIPLGFASLMVGKSAYTLRQEFIQRSNQ